MTLEKFMEFYRFCFEHGKYLKNHTQFQVLALEVIESIRELDTKAATMEWFEREERGNEEERIESNRTDLVW